MGETRSPDELLQRVATGDRAAFADLYDVVVARVHGMTTRVVRDPSQAEEVTQDVMIEVWKKAPRFDPTRGSAIGWILAMAHRRAVDRVRSVQRDRDRTMAHGASMQETPADTTSDAVLDNLDAAAVGKAVEVLTPLQREAIEMAYWRGLTYPEVATELGVPLGTVKTRIRDGMQRLATAMGGAR